LTEESQDQFEVYRSTNNLKRKPDDSLIESECARFKVSGADYAIIHLIDINRWLTISPVLQFNFHQTEKDAVIEMNAWKEKIKDSIIVKYTANSQISKKPPTELDSCIQALKERIADRYPGRLPTITTLDPKGGIITTTNSRTISSIQPISCPTIRFDINPPELFYERAEQHYEGITPSLDAATHCCMLAEIEDVAGVLSLPLRVKDKEKISILTDAEVLLSSLTTAEFLLERVIDENRWKDRSSPFVASFGRANSFVLVKKLEQIPELLSGDFFVRYE